MSLLKVLEGVRTIQLSKGYNALIDEDCLDLIGERNWKAKPNGYTVYVVQTTYTPRRLGPRKYGLQAMHRLIMGNPEGMTVDHRDGDGRNNTRDNLRIATAAENKRNRRKSCGTSRFKGVYKAPGQRKFLAYIVHNKKRMHLGYFDSEVDAAKMYDLKAKELFGEFACTNAELFTADMN